MILCDYQINYLGGRMKYIIEENIRSDEVNIKVVMSRREMFEIVRMLDELRRKLQKMQEVNDNGNSKK